jgi:hypothetical protein
MQGVEPEPALREPGVGGGEHEARPEGERGRLCLSPPRHTRRAQGRSTTSTFGIIFPRVKWDPLSKPTQQILGGCKFSILEIKCVLL